jgi:hypothetical protein
LSNITSEAENIVSELANDYATAEQEISELEKPNPKQTLIYVAGNVSIYQFAKDYAGPGRESLAIWLLWRTELSNGAFSFADDVYGCQNWNELCNLFLRF